MVTDLQIKKLKSYFKEMPIDETLSGLKFAKNRWVAKDAGILKVGRKSILKKEVHSVYLPIHTRPESQIISDKIFYYNTDKEDDKTIINKITNRILKKKL